MLKVSSTVKMTKRPSNIGKDSKKGEVGLGPLTLDDLGLNLDENSLRAESSSRPEPESRNRFKKFKNSLDSDEEDDEVKSNRRNVLNPNDLEGQEEGTIDHDGEIRITPFNMKDELEEGHFDKEGTFIFDKSSEIKDHWLDNIDWIQIKNQKEKSKLYESDSDAEEEVVDVHQCYKEMITYMQPKETVLKGIKRLGGNLKTSASSKWLKKKATTEEEDARAAENHEKMLQLTALADKILGTGNMDIYQQTYEKINFLIQLKEKPEKESADMFGDDFDVKGVASSDAEKLATASAEEEEKKSNEVQWEFKWEEKEDAPVYGPHSSLEMLHWVEEGYFKDGVLVRRINEASSVFYSSKRIDFELYT